MHLFDIDNELSAARQANVILDNKTLNPVHAFVLRCFPLGKTSDTGSRGAKDFASQTIG